MNETTITARMDKDGMVLEVLPDGSERPFPKQPIRRMTEEEIHAAALSDPEIMTDEATEETIVADGQRGGGDIGGGFGAVRERVAAVVRQRVQSSTAAEC